jgi:DNA polymerase (family 10)
LRGYRYLGVSDHSQSAHYAGGLKPQQIEFQHAAIDQLNQSYGGHFRILKGIESGGFCEVARRRRGDTPGGRPH